VGSDEWNLPAVGDVFHAETWIFGDGDDKDRRPVVVVRAPRSIADIVTVIERTASRFDLRGIDHPPDAELKLTKQGKWVLRYTRHADAIRFSESCVELVGSLPATYLDPLMTMWENL
jgi:hypothetical protein